MKDLIERLKQLESRDYPLPVEVDGTLQVDTEFLQYLLECSRAVPLLVARIEELESR